MLKRIIRNPIILKLVGNLLGYWLLLIYKTSKVKINIETYEAFLGQNKPCIAVTWHGEHFVLPFAKPASIEAKVLISKSKDGEINAQAMKYFKIGVIRASGGHNPRQIKKNEGSRGLREMIGALNDGISVVMTADVPKGPSRKLGLGCLTLAKLSQRPIIPVAVATSKFFRLNTWDQATINLPFSKIGIAYGEPIYIDRQANQEKLQEIQQQAEEALNKTMQEAYQLVGIQ